VAIVRRVILILAIVVTVGADASTTASAQVANTPQTIINPGGSCVFQNADYPHPSTHNRGKVKGGWGVTCSATQGFITLSITLWERFSNGFYTFYLNVANLTKTYTNVSSVKQQFVTYNCAGQGTQVYYITAVATFGGDGSSATISTQSPTIPVTCNENKND
jgi:hypothetical protein